MSKNQPITKEIMEQVISMRKRKVFVKDIANELNICMASVYKAIHLSNNFDLLRGSRATYSGGGSSHIDNKLIVKRAKPLQKMKRCGYDDGTRKCREEIPENDLGCRRHYHLILTGDEPAIEDVQGYYHEQTPRIRWS